jgi:hypothetical protein
MSRYICFTKLKLLILWNEGSNTDLYYSDLPTSSSAFGPENCGTCLWSPQLNPISSLTPSSYYCLSLYWSWHTPRPWQDLCPSHRSSPCCPPYSSLPRSISPLYALIPGMWVAVPMLAERLEGRVQRGLAGEGDTNWRTHPECYLVGQHPLLRIQHYAAPCESNGNDRPCGFGVASARIDGERSPDRDAVGRCFPVMIYCSCRRQPPLIKLINQKMSSIYITWSGCVNPSIS